VVRTSTIFVTPLPFTFKISPAGVRWLESEPTQGNTLSRWLASGSRTTATFASTWNFAYILRNNYWVRYRIPQSVIREIVAFDRGGSFEPGMYALMPPSPAYRLGRVKVGARRHVRTGPKKSRFVHATSNVRNPPSYVNA
jgi:hypothetical protein